MKKRTYSILTFTLLAAASHAATTIQFGGKTDWINNPAYQSQIGANDIVQWNGVNSRGGNFGASGSLKSGIAGSNLESPCKSIKLTTRTVRSSATGRNTVSTYGAVLGIAPANAKFSNFEEKDACAWGFDFNQPVVLKQILFSGMDYAADAVRVRIGDQVYNLTIKETKTTQKWSADKKLKVYAFPAPGSVSAFSEISIEAIGSKTPENNKWSVSAIVIELPGSNVGGMLGCVGML